MFRQNKDCVHEWKSRQLLASPEEILISRDIGRSISRCPKEDVTILINEYDPEIEVILVLLIRMR